MGVNFINMSLREGAEARSFFLKVSGYHVAICWNANLKNEHLPDAYDLESASWNSYA